MRIAGVPGGGGMVLGRGRLFSVFWEVVSWVVSGGGFESVLAIERMDGSHGLGETYGTMLGPV